MGKRIADLTVGQVVTYAVVIATVVLVILALKNWADEGEDRAECRADKVVEFSQYGSVDDDLIDLLCD